ncbi:hypothetical protein PM082_014807 [Marasmius tenuissimus]|nr:hypothetical protein PM082_014807 [Marasmius tenuissimus]
MSTFFANAQNFAIDGGNFSIVQGDQINQIIQPEEREHTVFDDFRNVKRGDIYKIQTICQVRDGAEGCQCEACPRECREVIRTFCAAKLIGVEGEFTAVTYSGRDARKVFEWEFLKYSRTQFTGATQIFAIDNGTIPSMVLWHNLLPLVQFAEKVGRFGLLYLESLRRQLGCWDEELWMDSSRGVICRGPKGPYSQFLGDWLEFKDLPPTAELLQEDVLVRFLASHKSKEADDAFLVAMCYAANDEDVPERVNRPTIFSTRTKTPIAVANNVWKSFWDRLVERTCLENGWTRFRLDGDGTALLGLNWGAEKAWLSQAWSVFHARGVSLEDDQEGFNLVYPFPSLGGYVNESPSKRQRRQQQAIFLFLYSPAPNPRYCQTSSFHHWSFQEDGQPQLSPELCCDLGLPVQLQLHNEFHAHSWSTDSYKLICQYQTLRGFDPTTADFARHLGYDHIFRPVDDSDRFEDIYKDEISACPAIPIDLSKAVTTIDSDVPSPSNARDHTPVVESYIKINAPAYIHATVSRNAVTSNTMWSNRETGNQRYLDQDTRHQSVPRIPNNPVSCLLRRNPPPTRTFAPISIVSRRLATLLPSNNSVEVLSPSLGNSSATGMLRSLIPTDKAPASRRGQRHLIRTNETAVSITVAQSDDDGAAHLA